jgi:hypothetical protein
MDYRINHKTTAKVPEKCRKSAGKCRKSAGKVPESAGKVPENNSRRILTPHR